MSNDSPDRQRRIADLEATLRLPVPESIRRQLEAELLARISPALAVGADPRG